MCESACNVVDEKKVVLVAVCNTADMVRFCEELTCKCVECKCVKNGLPPCCAKNSNAKT